MFDKASEVKLNLSGRHLYDKYQKCWAKSAQCFRCNYKQAKSKVLNVSSYTYF